MDKPKLMKRLGGIVGADYVSDEDIIRRVYADPFTRSGGPAQNHGGGLGYCKTKIIDQHFPKEILHGSTNGPVYAGQTSN